MRALYLVVLITLCLPLQAGDPADLNTAVEMFRSPYPAVRAEGTKIADSALRRLRAPFMRALQDPDPEVRRRVTGPLLMMNKRMLTTIERLGRGEQGTFKFHYLQAHAPFMRALRDPDPEVRRRVKGAILVANKRMLAAIGRLGKQGTFKFHYLQGFSFKKGTVVTPEHADVVFRECAGGISEITFWAPNGITNLAPILGRRTGLEAVTIHDAITRIDPKQLQLRPRAGGDARTPETDVFVVRTREGGWAKFCIEHRGNAGGWQQWLATIRYIYHPDKPYFSADEAIRTLGGIAFNRIPKSDALEDEARRAKRARAIALARRRAIGGGVVPDPNKSQEVLLSRRKFRSYEQATFSFRHGVRDDADWKRTRNNWDLEFGNGNDTLNVHMVTDDRSTITDLGEATWLALAKRKQVAEGRGSSVTADYKHVYLVRTQDSEGLYFSFVRVAAIQPGTACHIEWVSFQNKQLKMAPGLTLSVVERAALMRLLASHDERSRK